MIKAAKKGDIEKAKALLSEDSKLIDARDTDGSTALHCATWKGHQAMIAFLLSRGADVNAHNQNHHWGTTPLHAAAHSNQAAIAEMLIEAGADVNATDLNGKTPMHHTTFHKAKAAARVLEKHGAK
jgi:ankyrin repeat protein